MRLECAMLFVKDFARMKQFYMQMLGLQPVNTESADTWALFDTGGAGFALHATPGSDIVEPQMRQSAALKLIFAVDGVPAERRRLEAMGATMLQRAWQKPDEACDGVDPEGNVFQISRQLK